MEIREEFVQRALSGRFAITALCNAYGISEKTGHKWLSRFKDEGRAGLADRSHIPHEAPHKISELFRRQILSLREKHPTWGPKKLRAVLKRQSPSLSWPAASTIGELLRREGCVRAVRRSHRAIGLPIDSVLSKAAAPNDVWSTDFKGQFRLMNGSYCFPLTVQDVSSRFLIGTTALSSTSSVPVEIAFARHFEEFGLPRVIRSDNGVPFASPTALGRLSRLAVWWIKLGIRPERIEPAHPQQNGKHERMHKTLKAEATRPPSPTLREQQIRFDHFRTEYNNDRPHESLEQQTPASRYTSSTQRTSRTQSDFEYPAHFDVRCVTRNGVVSFRGRRFSLSASLINELVGFEEIDDELWRVDLGLLELGSYHQPSNTFIPEVRWKSDEPPTKGG